MPLSLNRYIHNPDEASEFYSRLYVDLPSSCVVRSLPRSLPTIDDALVRWWVAFKVKYGRTGPTNQTTTTQLDPTQLSDQALYTLVHFIMRHVQWDALPQVSCYETSLSSTATSIVPTTATPTTSSKKKETKTLTTTQSLPTTR